MYYEGKDTCYHLYHLKKIKHMEFVDPGTIKRLQENQIIFHWSDDNIKCDMWKVFNNKKSYMSIGYTDQEVVCCSIDIGTAFHDLLNDHYYYIRKDSVCMLRPSVDQFMLKVKKTRIILKEEKKDHWWNNLTFIYVASFVVKRCFNWKRCMIVLTQIFVNMEAILSFYNFLDKDGPRIQSWMSQGTPQLPWLCTLNNSRPQNEMWINDLTGVSSKSKRKFNTVADDEENKKHISETFKYEKEDMEFVVAWLLWWGWKWTRMFGSKE